MCRAVRARGFSLAELMGVICIIGVVSALAIGGFKRHVNASKTSEASMVLQAIRVAEESYRAENQVYLSVTSERGRDAGWFPNGGVYNQKGPFANPTHEDAQGWDRLNPRVDRAVEFGYKAHAGMAGDAATMPVLQTDDFTLPDATDPPTEPWYVLQARATFDENYDDYCFVLATSFDPEVRIVNAEAE
jgi:type II secretory pathway pseudopilin PulG